MHLLSTLEILAIPRIEGSIGATSEIKIMRHIGSIAIFLGV